MQIRTPCRVSSGLEPAYAGGKLDRRRSPCQSRREPRAIVYSGGRSENTDASGRSRPVTRPDLPLPWFARAPESPSRTLEGSWLAFSPSALGFPWALGSSGSGPRGTSRRIPTQVLSCACAPPQWLSLSRVAPFRRLSRPCHRHKAPRIGPRPFSISKQKNPFSRPAFGRASNRRCHTDWKSRLQGLATLLAA
jgi:hypothetical protein